MKHVYLPRRDKELKGIIRKWNQARKANGDDQYKVHYHYDSKLSKPLKAVGPNDRLYVFGHGNYGKGIGPTGKPLEPAALAERLEKDGLPDDREIRLLACWSGVVMPGYTDEYAVRLLRALLASDAYANITVVGYLGSVTLTPEGKKKVARILGQGQDGKTQLAGLARAKTRRVSYSKNDAGVQRKEMFNADVTSYSEDGENRTEAPHENRVLNNVVFKLTDKGSIVRWKLDSNQIDDDDPTNYNQATHESLSLKPIPDKLWAKIQGP